MSQLKEAVITLKDGNAYIDITDPSTGAVLSKGVSLDALGDSFQVHTSMRTPLLPGQWGTRFYAKKGNREYFALTIAPKTRNITWEGRSGTDEDDDEDYPDDVSMTINTPPLIWFVALAQNGDTYNIVDNFMFALKNDLLSMNDTLYRAPFTNVYSSHSICWNGAISMNLPSPASVLSLDSSFFNAKFNSDLDEWRFVDNGFVNSGHVYDLFKELDNTGSEFPLDILKSEEMNVGQFINTLMNR